jgi:uncharacterized protein YecE (DUF72 family)
MIDRDDLARRSGELARAGIYVGTSSWKYAGWRGQLYDEARYVYRGRFSERRFERLCLTEYSEVFKTVSVDAAYYQFPNRASLEEMASLVPADFRFALKVTEEITVKRFPSIPRLGGRAGQANPNFLDADLFASAFLQPCESVRSRIGLLMFEFSPFSQADFARGSEFAAVLDTFLGRIPVGWPLGVEVRNPTFLHPEYFAVLARHGVTHIYNSWTRMPSLSEQWAMPETQTHPDRLAARLLLRPGRKYEEAVTLFSPYEAVKDPYPEATAAATAMIKESKQRGGRAQTFIYVNNRLEGNALQTIARILEGA